MCKPLLEDVSKGEYMVEFNINSNNMEENHISSIYLDYQASTPLDPRVLNVMLPYITEKYGNPHSTEHSFGWISNDGIEKAKAQVASYVNSIEDEIIFTSGSTEANNLAIIGIGYVALEKSSRRKILVSSIEHKCVLGASRFLARFGFIIEKITVEPDGLIDIEKLKPRLTEDVLLVSVMSTNNEIGVNEPVATIGQLCHEKGILFHIDASQGAYTNLDVLNTSADFMSLSAHKIYGPKGIGSLYISQSASLKPIPIINGGGQHNGYRSGTLPTFLAVGMGEACSIMQEVKKSEADILKDLRDKLCIGLLKIFPNAKLNGHSQERHPGNLNLTIPGIDSKQLILSLQPNIAFSTGSACTSGMIEPSHVLKAIGLSTVDTDSSFRMSVGRFSTEDEILRALTIIRNYITLQ
jgi:cysteine desulfurase